MKNLFRFLMAFLVASLVECCVLSVTHAAASSSESWQTSTPERQGIDSETLSDMLEDIFNRNYNIRSVTIIRNGLLVLDAYFPPSQQDTWHIIHSCSKSITSALIGIAIDKGYIEGIDAHVLDFFPEKRIPRVNAHKKAMTLEHLLTMSSGLKTRDSYLYDFDGLRRMTSSGDWAQYVLDLPMAEAPGTRFEYSNGVSYLLSAILQKATGKSALAFAEKHLFGPLGITHVDWRFSPQGVNFGWGGIRMRPHDMAKIGVLYLNSGRWDNKQVVPAAWVETSTRKHINSATLTDWYGYQWWIDAAGYYMMMGYAGQYVIVLPRTNMVVVFTSALESRDFFAPEVLLHNFIISAAASSEPLPENPEGVARLDSLVKAIGNPEPARVPPLPQMAHQVSGRTYVFGANPSDFKTFSIAFQPQKDEARFSLSFGSQHVEGTIGLDNIYRIINAKGFLRALRGSWVTENTFLIDYQVLDYTQRGTIRMTFEKNKLTVWMQEEIEGTTYKFSGQLQD